MQDKVGVGCSRLNFWPATVIFKVMPFTKLIYTEKIPFARPISGKRFHNEFIINKKLVVRMKYLQGLRLESNCHSTNIIKYDTLGWAKFAIKV